MLVEMMLICFAVNLGLSLRNKYHLWNIFWGPLGYYLFTYGIKSNIPEVIALGWLVIALYALYCLVLAVVGTDDQYVCSKCGTDSNNFNNTEII